MKKIQLILKVTNGCNLRCKYCYNAEKGFKNDIISIDKIDKFFSLFKGFDCYQVIFHGGEPMLGGFDFYDKVIELEKYYTARFGTEFENLMQTNGTLIDDRWISLFKKYRINPGLSFDGIYNDSYRGGTDKVLKGLKLLKKNGFDTGCIAVVADPNYNVKQNYEYFKTLGNRVDFNFVYSEGNAKHVELLHIDNYTAQMTDLFDEWIYDRDGIGVRNFDMFLKKIFGCDFEYCSNGSCIGNFYCLDVDGSVYGCSLEAVKQYRFGNLDEFTCMHDIINTPNFKKYVKGSIERRKICASTCKYVDYCKGGCADNAILAGDIAKPNSEYCEYFKKTYAHIKACVDKILSSNTDLSTLNPHFRRALVQKTSLDDRE